MNRPHIALAANLNDRTRDLYTGTVAPNGFDLTVLPMEVEEMFWRMLKYQEFDASEMSMSSYMMARDQAWPELIAIPVFPSRSFRHSCVFVHEDAGIEEPADLRGKKVGVPEYQVTAAMMARGMLQHEYGVHPEELVWYHGAQVDASREEKLELDLPTAIELHEVPEGRTLSGMLETGELDGLISPRAPSALWDGPVVRLFEDIRTVERAYYQQTGIFPIMHTVVLREDVYERHPWLAPNLAEAFHRAKERCLERIGKTNEMQVALPWLHVELEATRELMGWDYWPYGVEANRELLETMTQYSHEQGLTKDRIAVDELFAPNTYDVIDD